MQIISEIKEPLRLHKKSFIILVQVLLLALEHHVVSVASHKNVQQRAMVQTRTAFASHHGHVLHQAVHKNVLEATSRKQSAVHCILELLQLTDR